MKRIVWHWTAGSYEPSDYTKSRYHFLIDGEGEVHEGHKAPEANKRPLGGDYVRHAGGFNTDSIGIGVCAMGGRDVREAPLRLGRYPVRDIQIEALIQLSADLCETYKITPGPNTTVMHSEIRSRFGVGKYKWDINYIPQLDKDDLVNPQTAGEYVRARVKRAMRPQRRSLRQRLRAAL